MKVRRESTLEHPNLAISPVRRVVASASRQARSAQLQRSLGNRIVTRLTTAGSSPSEVSRSAAQHEIVHEAARLGLISPSVRLPHVEAIQRAFGRHDVTGVQAHTGPAAVAAAAAIGARAFAVDEHIAFADAPDLGVVAHEAAHVIQQRAGVTLPGGVGQAGDPHERHADAVASRVLRGESAEPLLDQLHVSATGHERRAHATAASSAASVQRLMTVDGKRVGTYDDLCEKFPEINSLMATMGWSKEVHDEFVSRVGDFCAAPHAYALSDPSAVLWALGPSKGVVAAKPAASPSPSPSPVVPGSVSSVVLKEPPASPDPVATPASISVGPSPPIPVPPPPVPPPLIPLPPRLPAPGSARVPAKSAAAHEKPASAPGPAAAPPRATQGALDWSPESDSRPGGVLSDPDMNVSPEYINVAREQKRLTLWGDCPWVQLGGVYASVSFTGNTSWVQLVLHLLRRKGDPQRKFAVLAGRHGDQLGQQIDPSTKRFSRRDPGDTAINPADDAQVAQNLMSDKRNQDLDILVEDVGDGQVSTVGDLQAAIAKHVGGGRAVILAWCYSLYAMKPGWVAGDPTRASQTEQADQVPINVTAHDWDWIRPAPADAISVGPTEAAVPGSSSPLHATHPASIASSPIGPDAVPAPVSAPAASPSAPGWIKAGSGSDKKFYTNGGPFGVICCTPDVAAREIKAYRLLERLGLPVLPALLQSVPDGFVGDGDAKPQYMLQRLDIGRTIKPKMCFSEVMTPVKNELRQGDPRALGDGLNAISRNLDAICAIVGELTLAVDKKTGKLFMLDFSAHGGYASAGIETIRMGMIKLQQAVDALGTVPSAS